MTEAVFTPLRGENREAKARANKAAGYRCSQQISCSFADDLHVDTELLVRLGMPFGSGMGRGQVCGCVVGALLVLGLRFAPASVADKAARKVLTRKQNAFLQQFEERHGSLICRELTGRARQQDAPDPAAGGSFFTNSCLDLMVSASRLVEELLVEDAESARHAASAPEARA